MYKIGDTISGVIKEIISASDLNKKQKIIIDIGDPSWRCHLQWNADVASNVKLFKIGTSVEGWIIRKHEMDKFLAIGISNFGRFLPKSDTLAKYINALIQFKGILNVFQVSNMTINDISQEIVSEMKGLLNRCVKKDQWDWLFLYKGFDFEDDIEAIKLRDILVRIRESIKQMRKWRIINHSSYYDLWKELLERNFISKINQCILYLTEEKFQFDIVSIADEKKIDHKPSENSEPIKQIVKVQAHIRTGVSMSKDQKDRLRTFLQNHDLALVDNSIITLEKFDSMNWKEQTVVFGYDRAKDSDINFDKKRQEESIITDLVSSIKTERASKIHEIIVKAFADKLIYNGYTPKSNQMIDLYCQNNIGRYYIFEMKTITKQNEISQIRKAIAQLYEYRFIFGFHEAILSLVLDRPPYEEWVIDYLVHDRQIYPCWLKQGEFDFPVEAQVAFTPLMT
jgi:hypothetical protein